MAFGPNSNNPRERRSYAHTMISQLHDGEASFDQARDAIDAASGTRKGHESDFEVKLLRAIAGIGHEAAKSVVFIDWTGGTNETQRFGGYVMTPDEALFWEQRHVAAVQLKEHAAYNEIFGHGYPSIKLAAPSERPADVVWGKTYDLASDPADVRIEHAG
ncbi:MAG: hypothetical protein ABIP74_00605 [Candidatus Saccharimonas sp.]